MAPRESKAGNSQSLRIAQGLYRELCNGVGVPSQVGVVLDDLKRAMEHIRNNNSSDFDIKKLDVRGEQSAAEIAATIAKTEKWAKWRMGVWHADIALNSLSYSISSGQISQDEISLQLGQIEELLKNGGVTTDIFQDRKPTLEAISSLIASEKKKVAEEFESTKKRGQAR